MSIGFGRIPDLVACGPTGGAGPILALELVRTFEDLASLFGSHPCSARLQAAQVSALRLDMLAFIPAYAAFLALGARALGEELEGLTLVAVLTIIAAAVLDEIEGVILLDLIADLGSPPDNFDALFWTVRPKFALLGLAELAIAVLLVRGTWLARIAAVPVAAGAMIALYLLFANPRLPLMMEGHRYAWTALLIVALIGAVRPALVMRPRLD